MRHIPYREAEGALMWAAIMTRPDLFHTAQQLAKFNDNPGPAHWKVTIKAKQSLRCTKNLGITHGGARSVTLSCQRGWTLTMRRAPTRGVGFWRGSGAGV